jgi:TnpA family transposase
VFHGRKGEVTRAYYDGMEDQLSALGLVLNCIVPGYSWWRGYSSSAAAGSRSGRCTPPRSGRWKL